MQRACSCTPDFAGFLLSGRLQTGQTSSFLHSVFFCLVAGVLRESAWTKAHTARQRSPSLQAPPMQASYCEQIHHVTQTRESRFGLHFRKATRGIRAPSVVGIRLAPAFTLSGKLSAALRLSYVFDFVFRLQQASFRFDTHMSVHMPRQQPLQQGRFTQMVIPEAAAEVMNYPTGTLGPIMCQGLRVYVEAHTLLRNTTGQTRRPAENSRRGSHDCNCPVFPAYWPSSGFDSPAVLCSETV